jgi:hypothetical protein
MLANSRPKIVVTIHGIRTSGLWQKEITPYLAQHGLIFHSPIMGVAPNPDDEFALGQAEGFL